MSNRVDSRCSRLQLTDAREVNEIITCSIHITEPNLTDPPPLLPSLVYRRASAGPFFFSPFTPFKFDPNFSRLLCPPMYLCYIVAQGLEDRYR